MRIGTQLPAVIALLVIEPWRVGREGIRRRLIAEGAAVRTGAIVDSVRRKWSPRPVWIGRGVLLVRIGAQFPEIFRMDGERQRQNQNEKDNPHGDPPTSGTTTGLSLLPAGGQHKQAGNTSYTFSALCSWRMTLQETGNIRASFLFDNPAGIIAVTSQGSILKRRTPQNLLCRIRFPNITLELH